MLDKQDEELQKALKELDDCKLDPAIQKTENTLRDFVDEDGVERLKKSITDAIDQVQHSRSELQKQTSKLADKITELEKEHNGIEIICDKKKLEDANIHTDMIATDAHEMALLLESLARHYDQCTQAYDLSEQVTSGKATPSVSEELEELTEVLSNDARELDGVLTELYERQQSIATSSDSVLKFLQQVEREHASISALFKRLDRFGESELVEYKAIFAEFNATQSEHKSQVIDAYLPELQSLTDYYRLFLRSYYSMILEITRRRQFQEKMKSLELDMQKKLDKVVNDETTKRNAFLEESGSFLPGDLWPGLLDPPVGFRILSNDEWNLPEITEKSLNFARQQLNS